MAARAYSGVDSTRAAELVLEQRRREAWPYMHVYPPPDSIPVHEIRSIAAPAAGTPTLVLAYQVQSGMRFVMTDILQVYSGGAFLPGDALWTVNLNSTLGVASPQAMVIQGLVALPVPLGSLATGSKWHFPRAYEFKALDLVQSVVTNVNLGGGFFVSGFFGYLIPDLLSER